MKTNADLMRLAQSIGVPPVCCEFDKGDTTGNHGGTPPGTVVRTLTGRVTPAIKPPAYTWKRNGHWRFLGGEAKSFTRAVAWASRAFGIDLWSPSPFGGVVPKAVIDVAYEPGRPGK